MALVSPFVFGIAIRIAIAINRYSDLISDDLPRDNRYSDYGPPKRTGQDADEGYGGPQGQGVFGVFHANSFISNRSAGQLSSGPH